MANDSIVVLTGSRKGEVHPLDREISFGRSPDNTIQMDDMQVSRRHAVVIPAKEGALLRDLGSGNGTFVNGQRVLEHLLQDGEVFMMGRQQFQFREGSETTRSPKDTPSKIIQSDREESFESSDARNIYQTFFSAPNGSASEHDLR